MGHNRARNRVPSDGSQLCATSRWSLILDSTRQRRATDERIHESAELVLGTNDSYSSSLIRISFIGGLTVLASLLFYQWVISNYPIGTGRIELIRQTAYVVLALILAGVSLVLAAVTRYLMRSPREKGTKNSPLTGVLISLALNDKRSFHAFIVASLFYGVFFAFVSSFLVYQPSGRFSETYGVSIPSMLPVICCGPLGQMPQFVVYLTQQFAILIVPVNVILLIAVSWLVGLNVSIATYSYTNESPSVRGKWFGGLGAIVGLFSVCPTCAGFFLLTMLGLAGAVTFALTLVSLQVVFLAVGIPLLLLTPIITARKLPQSRATSCDLLGDEHTARE